MMAMRMTGRTMITMRTDMYQYCGPRVAFWAATSNGIVCAFAVARNNAIRYSFQLKTSTRMKVATRPGAATGRTIERNVRYGEAPSTDADSSSSNGMAMK